MPRPTELNSYSQENSWRKAYLSRPPMKKAILPTVLRRAGWFGLAAMLAAAPAGRAASPSVLQPAVIWVPEEWHTGGAYTAIQAGPDGRVYLGTTFYKGFARLLALPPGGREFQLIADMGTATGERTPGPDAQAKIHTKPAVAPDGKVYFGTKSGEPAEKAAAGTYPGGHLLVFDPQSGRVTDLGIPRARQSILAVGVDPRRSLAYAFTDPEAHLVTYDPRSRAFADRGVLGPVPPRSRYLVVLGNGDVYHHAGGDAFMRFSAGSGRIERLPLMFAGQGSYVVPYALAAGVDGRRFYGVGEDSGQVYTFSPGEQHVAVQLHGAAIPEGFAPPAVHYAMTAAPDGNAYYTGVFRAGPEGTLFLFRLNVKSGRPEIVGQVGPLPPPPTALRYRSARRLMVQGITAGPDGTIYIMLAYPLRVLAFPKMAPP